MTFVGFSPLIQNCSQHFPAERRCNVLEVQAGQGGKGLTELVSRGISVVGIVDCLAIDNDALDIIPPLMSWESPRLGSLDRQWSV
jgi:hypothetical protein